MSTEKNSIESTAKDGKILYAVAYNKRVKTKRGYRWIPVEPIYMHASDPQEVRLCVIQGNPRNLVDIVAIGPAIGHFVEDNHGEVLSAT